MNIPFQKGMFFLGGKILFLEDIILFSEGNIFFQRGIYVFRWIITHNSEGGISFFKRESIFTLYFDFWRRNCYDFLGVTYRKGLILPLFWIGQNNFSNELKT